MGGGSTGNSASKQLCNLKMAAAQGGEERTERRQKHV